MAVDVQTEKRVTLTDEQGDSIVFKFAEHDEAEAFCTVSTQRRVWLSREDVYQLIAELQAAIA